MVVLVCGITRSATQVAAPIAAATDGGADLPALFTPLPWRYTAAGAGA